MALNLGELSIALDLDLDRDPFTRGLATTMRALGLPRALVDAEQAVPTTRKATER